jgi:hypothetical protein
MRAFFAGGVNKMHIPWAVEGLPMLLHLSLFLFFGGLAIFLFNVDREVFGYVICWIGLFLMVYGMITVLPFIRQDSPYNSPLSGLAWFLYASINHVTFKILVSITRRRCWSVHTYSRCLDLTYHYQRMLGGMEKAAEETASKRSWEIDVQILDWTISALGDDDLLKSFFEAFPGFLKSELVNHHEGAFSVGLLKNFKDALVGFLRRAWSSNSVDASEKDRRLDISLEMGCTLAHWFASRDQDIPWVVHMMISEILQSVREQDNWVALAAQLYGLPERDPALRSDSLSLATLIHISRQYLRSDCRDSWHVLEALSKLDIGNTLPSLQHDFCSLWNELVQEARNRGFYSSPVCILKEIRHLYTALHQGTGAAPTSVSASTDSYDDILDEPSSYPFCNPASHRPDSTSHVSLPLPTPPGNPHDALSHHTASRRAEQANNTLDPPSSSVPTTTSQIRATSHVPDIVPRTNPIYSSCHPTHALPTVVVATTPQDITSTATLSRPLEGNEQQDSDIVATGAEPGITAPTHAPTPTVPSVPASLPNTPSESYDAGVTAATNSPHLAPPSIRSSIPASRPTLSSTLPHLRPRGLVNTKNICFANAVLQLLVNFPPFRDLFREPGYPKEQLGAGVPETGSGATPLVNATVRFLKEFLVEESPSTQQQSPPDTGGTSRADEDKKAYNVVDFFEPTYMYDAMKEKRQLKPLFVRPVAHVAPSCY